MTTPTTLLKLSDVQTEFGGTNPISLSEYYRGGTYVASATTASVPDGAAISTAGTIRMGMFRAVKKAGVISGSGTIQDIQGAPASCSASVTFQPSGVISGFSNSNANSLPARWTSATGTPGNSVWLQFNDTTGKAATSGALKTPNSYPLSSNVTIGWAHAGPYSAIGTATVNFYGDAGLTQLLGTITITVDIEST